MQCKIERCTNEVRPPYLRTDGRLETFTRCQCCINLERNYGITTPERNKMIKSQDYKCLICENDITFNGSGKHKDSAHVDHCHMTGKVRGILCSLCNKGIGLFHDDIEKLKKAITYLGED